MHALLFKQCVNTSVGNTSCLVCCSSTVQTCYTFFSMCLNSVQTACHAVVCCSITVQTVCSCLAMFEHCSKCSNIMRCFTCCPNTVRTVFGHVIHSFPCVQTVFKQPAVQWCAVQTLFEVFEHHMLLRVLSEHCPNSVWTCYTFVSMCSNRVQTARRAVVCCLNTVQTVCPCLAKFEHSV